MGIEHPIGGIIGLSEAQCESECLMDITCVGAEVQFGYFLGMNLCVISRIIDFKPKRSSVLYEIVFRCPSM